MNEIEMGVLEACQEYITRQHEMLPLLAAARGLSPDQVFYDWALRRRTQRGDLLDGNWSYFFHGLECDLRNKRDGRFLRIDFGPRGRVGLLDHGGVLRLIMTSVAPWAEFPSLQSYFAAKTPPFDENSGDWQKMGHVWDRLYAQGCFEQADPALLALQAQYSSRGADGLTYIEFPPELNDEIPVDCSVAHRWQLAPSAVTLLRTRGLSVPLPAKPVVANGDGASSRATLTPLS